MLVALATGGAEARSDHWPDGSGPPAVSREPEIGLLAFTFKGPGFSLLPLLLLYFAKDLNPDKLNEQLAKRG